MLTPVDQLSMGSPTDYLAFLKHLYLFYVNEIVMLEKRTKSRYVWEKIGI